MSRVAAEARRHKEANPHLYCHVERCLWRIVSCGKPTPCRNHPLPPTPPASAIPSITPSAARACNRCNRVVGMRVEVFLPSQRLVVCAACAVTMTQQHASARIVANTPPMASLFVCSDGWYSPIALNAKLHQDTLNAEAERFANRVRNYVERHAMEAAS